MSLGDSSLGSRLLTYSSVNGAVEESDLDFKQFMGEEEYDQDVNQKWHAFLCEAYRE